MGWAFGLRLLVTIESPHSICFKEARNGFHPSIPNQPNNTKFSNNLFRWKLAIEAAFYHQRKIEFPDSSMLPETMNDLCIVEVKKLNEENITSESLDIINYAIKHREYLKRQIDNLNPDVVVCCGSIDWYDIIYQSNYKVEMKLAEAANKYIWQCDDRLVIDFAHPSTWPAWVNPGNKDTELFDVLCELLWHQETQKMIKVRQL